MFTTVNPSPTLYTARALSKRPAAASPPSMRDELLTTLTAYQSLTQSLFASLESAASTSRGVPPRPPPSILAEISSLDEKLAALLEKARRHASNQRRITALLREIDEADEKALEAMTVLEKAGRELDGIVAYGREEIDMMKKAEKAAITPATLLSYAARLGKFTSAPPGYILPSRLAAQTRRAQVEAEAQTEAGAASQPQRTLGEPGQDQPHAPMATIPPWPTEDMMRRGALSAGVVNMMEMVVEPPAEQAQQPAQPPPAQAFPITTAHAAPAFEEAWPPAGDDEDMFGLDLNPDND